MAAAVLENMDILGGAAPDAPELAVIAAACLGEPRVELLSASADELGAAVYNITTGGLWRVAGTARTGCGGARGSIGVLGFSAVVKLVQSPLLWPGIGQVPAGMRAELVAKFPWQTEAQVYGSGLSGALPDGGRMPHVYRLADIDPQRTAIWMEDVAEAPAEAWTDQRFVDAARFLDRGREPGGPGARAFRRRNPGPGRAEVLL
jgi:hypothetical protein